MRLSRAALLPEVEEQATLPELLQHVDPEAGAAELDLAADTAQSASSQLAARQGEALECVTQELLANPDILRCAHHTDYCAYSVASCATVEHHPPFLMCMHTKCKRIAGVQYQAVHKRGGSGCEGLGACPGVDDCCAWWPAAGKVNWHTSSIHRRHGRRATSSSHAAVGCIGLRSLIGWKPWMACACHAAR